MQTARYGVDHTGPHQTPETEADYETLMRDGCVVLHGLVSAEHCGAIKAEAQRLIGQTGRNPFEGLNTQRVYNVLAKTRLLDDLIIHPRVLALLDRLFEPNYLLSQAQLINIRPGEAAQALHTDDGFYRIPRPRPPLGAATIFAIDAFTETNGATRIAPRTQHLPTGERPSDDETFPCVMPAGSAVFFLGTLWHSGGANRSSEDRLAFTGQYCEPWLRPQENFFLEVSRETARTLHPDLLRLMGYSVHAPFMGMVDGMHPLRTLE